MHNNQITRNTADLSSYKNQTYKKVQSLLNDQRLYTFFIDIYIKDRLFQYSKQHIPGSDIIAAGGIYSV